MSVVARACEANRFVRPQNLLKCVGVDTLKPCFLPFTGIEHVDTIATLLSIPPDTLGRATHPGIEHRGLEGVVDWFGTPLPRRYIEAEERRFSPQSLKDSPYHRSTWMVRSLTFCPQSCQVLMNQCPSCGASQKWSKTLGIARCDACGRSLRRISSPKIPWELRSDARSAAALVNPDSSVRRVILDGLPDPFRSWEAGDVFVAICELGMVASNLELPIDSGLAKRFGAGDFSFFKVEDLVAGYRIVRDWPESIGRLTERAAKIHSGGRQSIQSVLGILGKFLTKFAAPTAIAELMLEVLPAHLQTLPVSLKAVGTARIPTPRQNGLVTAQEAATQFGVCRKRLNNIGDQLKALAASSNRTKGVRLFELEAFSRSVAIARAAVPASEVCGILGANEFLLPSLELAGLICGVLDADAQLIAGQERIYDADALTSLTAALRAAEPVDAREGTRLSAALEGKFHPMAWAHCLSAIKNGKLRVLGVDASEAGFFDRLLVEHVAVEALVGQILTIPLPNLPVDVSAAAKLLGTTELLVRRFVEQNLIPRADGAHQTAVHLGDLQEFRTKYVLIPEIRRLLNWPPAQTQQWLRDAGVTAVHQDLPVFLRVAVEGMALSARVVAPPRKKRSSSEPTVVRINRRPRRKESAPRAEPSHRRPLGTQNRVAHSVPGGPIATDLAGSGRDRRHSRLRA